MNQFLSRLAFLLLFATPFVILAPVLVEAAPKVSSHKVTFQSHAGTINTSSLTTDPDSRAHLSGTATVPRIRISITASTASSTATTSSSPLYRSPRVTVRKGHWHLTVGTFLPSGTYSVTLFEDRKGALSQLATSTLTVIAPVTSDLSSAIPAVTPAQSGVLSGTSTQPGTLKVLPVALLAGGTAKPGSTNPISYLEVLNLGYATTTINGFWVKEDGTTPESAVIGFSSVDDQGNYRASTGGIEGKSPFVNGQAYVPSGAVMGPRQMKLFTIKAQLSANAGQYAGTNLMLDVSGVDASSTFQNAFPVRGTTWAISN